MPKTSPPDAPSGPAYIGLGNYSVVVGHLRSRLSDTQAVPEPYAVVNGTADFRKAVEAGLTLLPSRYHPAYVNVLSRAIDQAQPIVDSEGLLSLLRKRNVLNQLLEAFRTLAAPIVQLQSERFASELKAYLAVSSNLYQRFLGDDKIRRLNKDSQLWPELDPLGFFSGDAGVGPYTIVPSREMPLALVSKPVSMVGCLPLWVLDGHEVGGHGIHSILPDFTGQIAAALESAVGDAFRSGRLKCTATLPRGLPRLVFPGEKRRTVSGEEFFKHLAGTFALELAADMAGVLNLGPMFANGLILYFAATRKNALLQSGSRLLERGRRDAHPADYLRALAAIEAVRRLGLSQGASYVADLQKRLDGACAGETSCLFSSGDGTVVVVAHSEVRTLVEVMVDAALSRPLKCLADRSLEQVLTWTDRDEEQVVALAATMSSTKFAAGEETEARHIVAASLLATERVAHRQDFKRLTGKIQSNGISVLKSLYSEQCLLCAVPTYARSRRTATSLADLLQRIRDARGDGD